MIGVTSGTNSSRGVRAVSWKRRRASVASEPKERARACGAGSASSAVDMALLSGGRGERAAGQPQVDVVEGRLAGGDRSRETEVVDGGDGLLRGGVVERQGQRRADGKRVVAGDASVAELRERRADVAVDAELDELAAEVGEQSPRRVERDDPAGVDDRDAVAQS